MTDLEKLEQKIKDRMEWTQTQGTSDIGHPSQYTCSYINLGEEVLEMIEEVRKDG